MNSLGQRTSVQHEGSAFARTAFNLYGYDGLGQVTSAKRFGNGTLAAPKIRCGQQFGFGYDMIGNRKTAMTAYDDYTATPSINIHGQHGATDL